MAMSIRGLPDDVKERLRKDAKRQGLSLNAHVVEILSVHAAQSETSRELVERFAGTSTYEAMIEARRIEQENALDWSMSYDDPPRR